MSKVARSATAKAIAATASAAASACVGEDAPPGKPPPAVASCTAVAPDTEPRGPTLIQPTAPYRLENCRVYPLRDSPWLVQGYACAGERSGYFIHGPGIVVDCGLGTMRTPLAVFITHRHTDHTMSLPTVTCSRTGPRKGQEHLRGRPVYLPREAVASVTHLCASIGYLADGVLPVDADAATQRIGVHLFPVDAGDVLRDIPGVPNVVVEVLKGHHGDAQSVGYGFSEVRSKLKKEFASLSGPELAALRKSGVELSEKQFIPYVAIYGDTTPDALTLHDEWQKYPNVFIEATGSLYLNDPAEAAAEVAKRRQRCHTHINELLPIMLRFREGRRWFVHHLTLANSAKEIYDGITGALVSLLPPPAAGDDNDASASRVPFDWTLVSEGSLT